MDRKLQFCQTCLSSDRYLYPLGELQYALVGFYVKLNMSGGVCFECKRSFQKMYLFRNQARSAQATLKRCNKIENIQSLSKLRTTKRIFYYSHEDPITHTNLTCSETGPIMIKQEVDLTDFDNNSQAIDTGYVQIITNPSERKDEDVVYEIEDEFLLDDNIYREEWWLDDNPGQDWTCEKGYTDLCKELTEQVQKQIISVERESHTNKKDLNETLNRKNHLDRKNETVFTSPQKVDAKIQASRNKKNEVDKNEANVKRKKSVQMEDNVSKLLEEITQQINDAEKTSLDDHNYCQVKNATRSDVDHVESNHDIIELPRITLVESIQGQPSALTKDSLEFTEIIELNIPIHLPDSSGSSEATSGDLSTRTADTEDVTDFTLSSTGNDTFWKTSREFDRSRVGGSNKDVTGTRKSVSVNSSVEIENSVNNKSTSSNNDKNVSPRKDTNVRTQKPIASTSKSKEISKNTFPVKVTSENKQNKSSASDTSCNRNVVFFGSRNATSASAVKTTSNSQNNSNLGNISELISNIVNDTTEAQNEPKDARNKVDDGGKSSSKDKNVSQTSNVINKEVSSKEASLQAKDTATLNSTYTNTNAASVTQKTKEKDTITVKVKYLAKPPTDRDVREVKIKSEPISDDEDIVVDDCSVVHVNQHVNNDTCRDESLAQVSEENKLQQKLWRTSVLLVYNRLRAHRYASTFLHPVSDAIAPDYSKITKKPRHLVGIRKSVYNGEIKTTAEFHREILLMLTNALMYNSSDSSVYHMAKDFLEETKNQMDVLQKVHEESTLPSNTTTPRPRSKRRQDLEERIAKRPKLTSTPIVPKIEKVDKKSRSKSKIVPNPLSASRRVKKEKEVKNKVKNEVEEEKKKRGRRRKASISVKKENIQIHEDVQVKKVSENCLLIGSKIVPVPDSSDTDEVQIGIGKVGKTNEIGIGKAGKTNKTGISKARKTKVKPVAADSNINKKANVDVKPKIDEIKVTPTPKRRGRQPRKPTAGIKTENSEVVTSTVKPEGKGNLSVRYEALAKMPDMSPIVKLEPLSMSKDDIQDSFNQELSDNPDTLDDFCVAITTEPQKDLTHDEASLLKKVLEEKILQIALDFSKFAPRFRGKPIIADGVVKLWCEDAPSLKWLKKTVADLKKGFVVKKQADLPKKIKSAILIPGSNGEMVVTQKILAAQNPWAQVGSWAFYSSEQRGENMILVIGIPSTLIPVILCKHRRLAYILGSVYVKFYNSEGKLTDSAPEECF